MPTCIPSPIAWTPSNGVRILDQTLLPGEEAYRDLETVDAVAEAIRMLRVRGAPLIGIAAAMGVTVAAGLRGRGAAGQEALQGVKEACKLLSATRPTAVNLHWALARMLRRAERACTAGEGLWDALVAEANAIWEEDRAMCRRERDAMSRPRLGSQSTRRQ